MIFHYWYYDKGRYLVQMKKSLKTWIYLPSFAA